MAGLLRPVTIHFFFVDGKPFLDREKTALTTFGNRSMSEFNAKSFHFNLAEDGMHSFFLRFPENENHDSEKYNRFTQVMMQVIPSSFIVESVQLYEWQEIPEILMEAKLQRKSE